MLPGLKELLNELQELPKRIQYNVLRTSIFRGAQAVRDLAKAKLQANGSVNSGRLLRDIKATRAKGSATEVVAKVEGGTRKGKRSGWYGFLVEKGHLVKRTTGFKARGKNTRSFNSSTQGPATQIVKVKAEVGHVPGKPFLVPALEENREKIKADILAGIKTEIAKATAKINMASK